MSTAATRRVVRALRDRRRGLEAPAAEFVIDDRPLGKPTDTVDQTRHGEDVRDDVVRAGMTDLVVVPGAFEESHETWIVDRLDRCGLPVRRLGQREPVVAGQRVVDGVGSARVLEWRLQPRRLDLGERRVTAMTVGSDHEHRRTHDQWTTPARRSASVRCGSTNTAASASSSPSAAFDWYAAQSIVPWAHRSRPRIH